MQFASVGNSESTAEQLFCAPSPAGSVEHPPGAAADAANVRFVREAVDIWSIRQCVVEDAFCPHAAGIVHLTKESIDDLAVAPPTGREIAGQCQSLSTV